MSPVYDFECPACKTVRTETVSIHVEEFVAKCACGEVMKKVYGVGAVTFKGDGFYSKDSKK